MNQFQETIINIYDFVIHSLQKRITKIVLAENISRGR